MARLVIGIIIGTVLSLVSISMFYLWIPLLTAIDMMQSDPILGLVLLLMLNFSFDALDLFMGFSMEKLLLYSPLLAAWIITGYVSGTIAKGAKRGLIAGILVVVINLLLWILFSVFAAIDLMSLFQGPALMTTLGGIIGAVIGGVVGGLVGGAVAGPYEEFY
ncbi:MAG: hypothetical protein EU544_02585 [Promethearchaeota archaeon]|nr:MAG: hypothetical protein EU544_02585 [Candidatus Lokiarchaeota archaeon]